MSVLARRAPSSLRAPSRVLTLGSVALLVTGLLLGGPASADVPADRAGPAPTGVVQRLAARMTVTLPLPAGFQPEGIATDGARTAYLGSRTDGDIYRLNLRTGGGSVISQGPGTPSLGMKLDARGRLFVAGGTGGDARVVNTNTGRGPKTYQLSLGTSFVNDVLLTRGAVWFTDSAAAQLYRLPFREDGKLAKPGQVETLPLTGAWRQSTGNNANGIATTPDGRGVLVMNSADGLLYRVDPRTGNTSVVDTGGALANGDGLLREGRTLYVVQNRLNQIAKLRLDKSGYRATRLSTITSATFDVPSTIARNGGRLYLPNARFTTPATTETPYAVSGLKIRAPR
ncbi:MAG: superoxide dismutase [Nocardioides sp.]|nr:superoxide dismutase [Nocardioides sp.]